jgi:large subunit ribosomal protein L24
MSNVEKSTGRWIVKKGDQVMVISGKSRGHKGEVLKVLRSQDKVVVSGAGIVVKHVKPAGGNPGSIQRIEKPIHRSNVMLFDSNAGAPSRIGRKLDGEKLVRYFKKSGKEVV